MVKVYFDVDEDYVKKTIKKHLKYFGDIKIFEQKVKIPESHFIYKSYVEYKKLEKSKYEMTKYYGMYNGDVLYEFYTLSNK